MTHDLRQDSWTYYVEAIILKQTKSLNNYLFATLLSIKSIRIRFLQTIPFYHLKTYFIIYTIHFTSLSISQLLFSYSTH